jgi:hypothetical protein
MELPLYELKLDEQTNEFGVDIISLVDAPAIEKNYVMFESHKVEWTANNERMIVSGPAMIPDKLIYRNDANGEYNTVISKDTIEAVVLRYMEQGNQSNVNLMHGAKAKDVFVFESFLSDSQRGIAPMAGYEDLPNGTWFVSMKVNNPAVWQQVKEGKLKGFSIEGFFGMEKKEVKTEMSIDRAFDEILELVKEI